MKTRFYIIAASILLMGCATNQEPKGLYTRDYYFPYADFVEPVTYCYININDTLEKSYWVMHTVIESTDTFLNTRVLDSRQAPVEELSEKITVSGSELVNHSIQISSADKQHLVSAIVIEPYLFRWHQRIGETITWKADYPEYAEGVTMEFTKKRTLLRMDTANLVAVFSDRNDVLMKESDQKSFFTTESHYQRGTGLIKYVTETQAGEIKVFKLMK